MPSVIQYTAASLSEYFQIIRTLGTSANPNHLHPFWYRGQECDWGYQLGPTLFRDNDESSLKANSKYTYSCNHLEEEYRYQHFRAKGSHLLRTQIDNSLEWKELMQHHLVHSRLMDWSESALIALQFALEAYLKTENDIAIQEKRRRMSPVIWVLDPHELNQKVVDTLCTSNSGNYPYIKQAFEDYLEIPDIIRIGDELSKKTDNKYSRSLCLSPNFYPNIDNVVCLSAIMELIREKGNHLREAIQRREINPLFFMFSRFYNDGLVLKNCELPPLAIVHPYHSRRIQAQRGVFTIFPHREMSPNESNVYQFTNKQIDPRALENHPEAYTFLYKIRLISPARIAKELFLSGGRDSNLYPELEYYAKEIEAKTYYF